MTTVYPEDLVKTLADLAQAATPGVNDIFFFSQLQSDGVTYADCKLSLSQLAVFMAANEGGGVILTSGAPTSSTGLDGNVAIDPAAGMIYGPKANGAWPAGATLYAQLNPTSQSLVEGYANTAQSAANTATSAAAAAAASALIYATTTAGLAATASAKYFWVSPSAYANGALDLYLNNSGTAVYQVSLAGAAVIDQLKKTLTPASVPGWAFAVVDSLGNIAGGFMQDGTFAVYNLVATQLTIAALTVTTLTATNGVTINGVPTQAGINPTYLWAITDSVTNVAMGVRQDGTTDIGKANITQAAINQLTTGMIASPYSNVVLRGDYSQTMMPDIAHLISYGQSLSQGINSGGAGVGAVITATQRFYALKFNGGVRAQDYSLTDVAGAHASFQPLVETIYNTGNGGVGGETPQGGTTDSIYERLIAENPTFKASSLQLLGSAPGYGGLHVSELSKGTAPFQRIIDDVTYGFSLAQTAGKTYRPMALSWTQGEADQQSGTTNYQALVTQLKSDVDSAIQTALGDSTVVVPWFCYQMASWANGSQNNTYPTIPFAMQAFAAAVPNVYISHPMYQFDYVDQYHMLAKYYKVMGAYYGIAMKRVLVDGQVFKPCQPTGKYLRQGNILSVQFNVPVGSLVFDNVGVSDPGNYGFSIVDSSGNTKTLASVPVITSGNTVRFVGSTAWNVGDKLRYGFIGQSSTINRPGCVTGNRGCLRDQQGDHIVFDTPEIGWAMHNWCLMFELALST